MNLADLKAEAEYLEGINPQRGALLARAVNKVEEGLAIFAQLGYRFDSILTVVVPPSEPSSGPGPDSPHPEVMAAEGVVKPELSKLPGFVAEPLAPVGPAAPFAEGSQVAEMLPEVSGEGKAPAAQLKPKQVNL